MSDERPTPTPPDPDAAPERPRDHLRVVRDIDAAARPLVPMVGDGDVAPIRPRSIGRLIAQTAMIAESAVQRRLSEMPPGADARGRAGRLLGRRR